MPLFPPAITDGTAMGQFPVWDHTARVWRALHLTDGYEPNATYRFTTGAAADFQARAGNLALGFGTSGRLTWTDYNFNTQGGVRHGSVATADATVTTVLSEGFTGDYSQHVLAQVAADQTGGANSAGYLLSATIKRAGGGLAVLVGATAALATHEDVAAWAATLDVDGATSWRIRVTGAAATNIVWRCIVHYVQQAG
jgi:hypothetical protein